eukprot:11493265-Alexandrium_andersonii.AAC.1
MRTLLKLRLCLGCPRHEGGGEARAETRKRVTQHSNKKLNAPRQGLPPTPRRFRGTHGFQRLELKC